MRRRIVVVVAALARGRLHRQSIALVISLQTLVDGKKEDRSVAATCFTTIIVRFEEEDSVVQTVMAGRGAGALHSL
jgi:hypothetical protein